MKKVERTETNDRMPRLQREAVLCLCAHQNEKNRVKREAALRRGSATVDEAATTHAPRDEGTHAETYSPALRIASNVPIPPARSSTRWAALGESAVF